MCVSVHDTWNSENESVLSFHLYIGFEAQTQAIRFVGPVPLLSEPSHLPCVSSLYVLLGITSHNSGLVMKCHPRKPPMSEAWAPADRALERRLDGIDSVIINGLTA